MNKNMIIDEQVIKILNELSSEINLLYGYVTHEGENFGEPAINSGPCGPFAKLFTEIWNEKFEEKVHIVFVLLSNSDECWHILVRLPNKMLFDGGIGVHQDNHYPSNKFDLLDMRDYDEVILNQYANGLDRRYPRYCPNFSLEETASLIKRHLTMLL